MSIYSVFEKLAEQGYWPKVAIDCGYHIGDWTAEIKHRFYDVMVLGVEANTNILPRGQADIQECAVLWSEDGIRLPFYQVYGETTPCTGDSVFRERDQPGAAVEYRTSATLNTLVKKHTLSKIDVLKMDVQGAELEVLKGCSDFLSTVDFVQLECALVEYNIGAPSIYEVFAFMKEQFDVHDITELMYANGNDAHDLTHLDIMFKRRNFIIEGVR